MVKKLKGTSIISIILIISAVFFSIFFTLGANWPLFTVIKNFEFPIDGITITTIMYFLVIFFSLYRDKKNNEIENIDEKFNNQQKQLENETKQLWKKFNDILFYKDRQNLRSSMKTFVRSNPFISGVQLYNYSLKHKLWFRFGRRFRSIDLKLNHKESYAAETEDLNAIIQMYESIPLSIYRQYVKVRKSENPAEVAKFIDRYTKTLQKKFLANKKINNEDLIIFYILILTTQYLYEIILDDDEIKELKLQNIKINGINNSIFYNSKRTGILRAILNDEASNKTILEDPNGSLKDSNKETQYYIFRNRKFQNGKNLMGAKEERIYLARTFTFQNSPHLLLLIVQQEILQEEEGYKKLFQLEKTFSDLLEENKIQLGYNV